MKLCSGCNTEKEITEFNRKGEKLQPYCKICNRKKSRSYYRENKSDVLKKVYLNRSKRLVLFNNIVNKIKSDNGCCFCEENEPCCIDFHHLKDKKYEIASAKTQVSFIKIFDEIKKCSCLCSNCHRKWHAGFIKNKEPHYCTIPNQLEIDDFLSVCNRNISIFKLEKINDNINLNNLAVSYIGNTLVS